jgi:hypothetical protein
VPALEVAQLLAATDLGKQLRSVLVRPRREQAFFTSRYAIEAR